MTYLHFKGQVLRHRAKADEIGLEDCCGQAKSVTERTELLHLVAGQVGAENGPEEWC